MRSGRIGQYAAVSVVVGLSALGQAWGGQAGFPDWNTEASAEK